MQIFLAVINTYSIFNFQINKEKNQQSNKYFYHLLFSLFVRLLKCQSFLKVLKSYENLARSHREIFSQIQQEEEEKKEENQTNSFMIANSKKLCVFFLFFLVLF